MIPAGLKQEDWTFQTSPGNTATLCLQEIKKEKKNCMGLNFKHSVTSPNTEVKRISIQLLT